MRLIAILVIGLALSNALALPAVVAGGDCVQICLDDDAEGDCAESCFDCACCGHLRVESAFPSPLFIAFVTFRIGDANRARAPESRPNEIGHVPKLV